MLTPYPSSSKYILQIIFGSAFVLHLGSLFHYWYVMEIGFPYVPRLVYECIVLMGVLIWNPKGVRLVVLAVLGYLLYWDIAFTFFIHSSNLPYWYLFRDVYVHILIPEIFYFLFELGLIGYMLYLTFKWKTKKRETDLLDD